MKPVAQSGSCEKAPAAARGHRLSARSRAAAKALQRARAGRAVLHLDAVLDDANDHVVADECASGHERLGLLADLGAGGDSGAAAARGRCVREWLTSV